MPAAVGCDGGTNELALLASPLGGSSEDDLLRHYQSHMDDYQLPERVVLGQVLAQDEATAREVHTRTLNGADLETAAEGLEGAVFGGYQEDVARADLPLRFSEAVFAMQAGDVSSVIEVQFGFHVFHVRERRPAETLSLAEARPQIERDLESARSAERLRRMVEEARVRYNVTLRPRNLPFEIAPAP